MSKHYKNPPLLEAVCEFKFQSPSSWNPAFHDLIDEKVRMQFPRREPMNSHEAQESGPNAKTKFRRADGSALLQVSPGLLAINQLRPYPTWVQFKQTILEAYALYGEIIRPARIERLGLRYINQIEIPETKIAIGRYLRSCPEGYYKLFLSTEFPFETERENLFMILMHAPHEEGGFSRFFLDLDYSTRTIMEISSDAIDRILERGHSRIEQVFESSLTDETRWLFGWERKAQPYRDAQALAAAGVIRETQAPYGTPAATAPLQNFLPAAPIEESAVLKATASAVATNFVEFYDQRLQELGEKVGKSAEEREAERWERLEMEMGVERDIVFKTPDVPKRRITAKLRYRGRPEPKFYYDPVGDD